MKQALKLLIVFQALVLFQACNNCKDLPCFTPPQEFNFQLIDKNSGADLVLEGTYNVDEIKLISVGSNKALNLSSMPSESQVVFLCQEIGWESGIENEKYVLILSENEDIEFDYLTEIKDEDCCTFYGLVKIDFKDVETEYETGTNILRIKR